MLPRNDFDIKIQKKKWLHWSFNGVCFLCLSRIKEKFPYAFDDICLYSEVSHLLAHCMFRLPSRRFIQELFQDVHFIPVRSSSIRSFHFSPVPNSLLAPISSYLCRSGRIRWVSGNGSTSLLGGFVFAVLLIRPFRSSLVVRIYG